MKLLFDQNISFRIVSKIIDTFPGSKHLSEVGLNNCNDIDIWHYARSENFVIVTFDSDYFELSIMKGYPPKVIWLRTGNLTTDGIKDVLISYSEIIHAFVLNEENSDKACLEID